MIPYTVNKKDTVKAAIIASLSGLTYFFTGAQLALTNSFSFSPHMLMNQLGMGYGQAAKAAGVGQYIATNFAYFRAVVLAIPGIGWWAAIAVIAAAATIYMIVRRYGKDAVIRW